MLHCMTCPSLGGSGPGGEEPYRMLKASTIMILQHAISVDPISTANPLENGANDIANGIQEFM